jgi:Phage integrase, N-terminal/Integrase
VLNERIEIMSTKKKRNKVPALSLKLLAELIQLIEQEPTPGTNTIEVNTQPIQPNQETAMRPLNFQIKEICRQTSGNSFATQADRLRMLNQVANDLENKCECRGLHLDNLKPKHISSLIEVWRGEGITDATLKNRMAALRWLADKIGKPNIIPRTNAACGIADRVYVTNISKAQALDPTKLEAVTDVYVGMSLRLQQSFGLRREESIKIVPAWADRGDHLLLRASWTKGGREREVPLRTDEQRRLINDAKALASGKSLVGEGYKTYRAYLQHFRYQCDRAGIHKVHGHRHLYAQNRYKELTGRECPARGEPSAKTLSVGEKAIDREARLIISEELGHGREQITAIYLGR